MERGAMDVREAAMKLEEFWLGALKRAAVDGDVERGSIMAGQSVGLVRSVISSENIIRELVADGTAELERILKECSSV